jgi:hypothetical protein
LGDGGKTIKRKLTDYQKLYAEWQNKIKVLQDTCSHPELSIWEHDGQGWDHKFCLNCMKILEEREGHYYLVTQLPYVRKPKKDRKPNDGYLFWSNGKWVANIKKATVLVGDDKADEAFKGEYGKNGPPQPLIGEGALRVMPVSSFTKRGY